ncbi:MAG: hypothetical protein ABSB74_18585 [Tepidisphaeraceae bacterium]
MSRRMIVRLALLLATVAFATVGAEGQFGGPAAPAAQPAAQPATQPSDSIDEATVQSLKEKAAAAHDALEKVRDAALARSGVEQTAEYKQALADLQAAQDVLDSAGYADARMKAATDKANARARLQQLKDKAIASDPGVADARKADAAARAELRAVQARFHKAQAAAVEGANPASDPSADEVSRELARLRAVNNERNATTAPAAAPLAYGKISGAAWTVKNDGTSSLMRGIQINIVERETTDIASVITDLKFEQGEWQHYADGEKQLADDQRKQLKELATLYPGQDCGDLAKLYRETADEYDADAASGFAKVKAIKTTIAALPAMTSIDRFLAFELVKQRVGDATYLTDKLAEQKEHERSVHNELQDVLDATAVAESRMTPLQAERAQYEREHPDERSNAELEALYPAITPRVIGASPSDTEWGSGQTNVDGKFVIDKVQAGDYYLVSSFESSTLLIEWIIPIHVEGDKETTVDLYNDTAAYICEKK